MFHSRTLNNRINRIHEKDLRLVYKDETFLSFALRKRYRYSELSWSVFSRIRTEYRNFSRSVYNLLKRDKSVNIHQKNLQILATEIYKAKNDLELEIMIKRYFSLYTITMQFEKWSRTTRTEKLHSVLRNRKHLLPQELWEIIPSDVRNQNSLEIFKEKITF